MDEFLNLHQCNTNNADWNHEGKFMWNSLLEWHHHQSGWQVVLISSLRRLWQLCASNFFQPFHFWFTVYRRSKLCILKSEEAGRHSALVSSSSCICTRIGEELGHNTFICPEVEVDQFDRLQMVLYLCNGHETKSFQLPVYSKYIS